VQHITTIWHPSPYVHRRVIIRQSHPFCRYGHHWVWTNRGLRGGVCVRDYPINCMMYLENLGVCRTCAIGYRPFFTAYFNSVCIPYGVEDSEAYVKKSDTEDLVIVGEKPYYANYQRIVRRVAYRRPTFRRSYTRYRRPSTYRRSYSRSPGLRIRDLDFSGPQLDLFGLGPILTGV